MSMEKGSLEDVMEERKSIIQNIFNSYLGVSIKELNDDITRKLDNDMLDLIPENEKDYRKAKRIFIKHYLMRLLRKNYGNIKSTAKDLGVDRRTVHRFVDDFSIDLTSLRKAPSSYYKDKVYDALEGSIKRYEDVLHPKKLDNIYKKMPDISRSIAENTSPAPDPTLREAEDLFDAIFLKRNIEISDSLSEAAASMGMRYETLYRKMNRLRYKGLMR